MYGTLDVLLFHGTDVWPSRIIEWLLGSTYSHIALVLHNPSFLQVEGDSEGDSEGVYMLESGEESRPCVVGGEFAWGVQVQPLARVARTYPGTVSVRRLVWTDGRPPADLETRLADAWAQTKHAPYDTSVLDFLRVKTGCPLEGTRQTRAFVCSVYAAYILCKAGVLPSSVDWNTLSPSAFAPGGRIDALLAECGVASLGPVEPLSDTKM